MDFDLSPCVVGFGSAGSWILGVEHPHDTLESFEVVEEAAVGARLAVLYFGTVRQLGV